MELYRVTQFIIYVYFEIILLNISEDNFYQDSTVNLSENVQFTKKNIFLKQSIVIILILQR